MATTISGKVFCSGRCGDFDCRVELHNAIDDVATQTTVDDDGRYPFYVTEGVFV
jgi:hypothetical protein